MRKWTLIAAALLYVMPFGTAQDIEIGGLIDVGFVHNFNDPVRDGETDNLGPVCENGEDDFVPTLVQLEVSKEAEPVGFQVKLDFFATAVALGDDTYGTSASDDIEVQAANIIYQVDIGNGLTIVAGKMDTLVGHDKVESSKNANMTHGLIYGVLPKTHVGVRALYPLMDNLTVGLGVNNGSDQDADDNHGKSIEALLSYSPLEELAIDLAILYGAEYGSVASRFSAADGWDALTGAQQNAWLNGELSGDEANKTFVLNLIATYDVTEEASVFAELAYGAGEAPKGWEDQKVVGIGVGGTYDITDVYSLALRYEYLEVDSADIANITASNMTREGTEYLWEITVTGQAKLTEDLILRLEFRYDKSTDQTAFDDDDTGAAAGDDSQAVLGAQLLYTF